MVLVGGGTDSPLATFSKSALKLPQVPLLYPIYPAHLINASNILDALWKKLPAENHNQYQFGRGGLSPKAHQIHFHVHSDPPFFHPAHRFLVLLDTPRVCTI